MASRNEQGQIGIPSLGVRKDVNELVSTSDMAIDAQNVMVYDATVRPRPALTREGFGGDATLWQEAPIRGDLAPAYAECITFVNGVLLSVMRNDTTQERWLRYSSNGGTEWFDDFISSVPAWDSGTCVKLLEVGGRLFWFESEVFFLQLGSVYEATIGTYPATPMTFASLFGSGVQVVLPPRNPRWIRYDSVTDSLFVQRQYTVGAFLNNPPVDPGLGGGFDPGSDQMFYWPNFSTISDENDIVQMPTYGNFRSFSYGGYRSKILGFQGGLVWIMENFEFWSNPNGRLDLPPNSLMRNRNYLRGYTPGSFGSPAREATVLDIGIRTDVFTRDPRVIYEYDADTIAMLWTNGLQLIDLTNSSIAWYDQPYAQLDPNLPPIGPSPDARLDIYDPGNSPGVGTKQLYTGLTETFTIVENPVPEAPTLEPWDDFALDAGSNRVLDLLFDPGIGDGVWYLISRFNPFGWKDWRPFFPEVAVENPGARIWLAPGGSAPPGFESSSESGDLTAIFQANLDREENAVVVGTTQKILKLNRATRFWDELTGEAITIAPQSPNTRLNGTWGENPVIFRIFESGSARGDSRTWLLATNGVDHPLVWTDDLPNGKMRFMGQIIDQSPGVQVDPGYIEDDTDPFGVSAPIARAMAVASNRVLLGNLPAISGYAVDVSSFNDMDRGWGRVQRTLVGDTPGEIVSLNEISALAVAIYKTDAIYSAIAQVDFVQTQAPFRFELVKAGVPGPCSPMCVLRMHTGEQAYLGRDGGVYVYDGVAPRDVGRNVRRMVQPFLDTQNVGKAWGMVDNARKLLWFFYPTKSQNINRGIVMSTDQGLPFPVWPIQMPAGWQMTAGQRCFFETDTAIGEIQDSLVSQDPKALGDYRTGREEVCMGRINNSWYTQKWNDDGDYTDQGIPIECFLKTGWNPLGSMIQFKTVHELYHLFKSEGNELTVNMSVAAHQADRTVLLSGPEGLTNISTQLRTNHRATGTRFSIELDVMATRLFNWGGATATFAPRGMR